LGNIKLVGGPHGATATEAMNGARTANLFYIRGTIHNKSQTEYEYRIVFRLKNKDGFSMGETETNGTILPGDDAPFVVGMRGTLEEHMGEYELVRLSGKPHK
jgi:hypothetical protein